MNTLAITVKEYHIYTFKFVTSNFKYSTSARSSSKKQTTLISPVPSLMSKLKRFLFSLFLLVYGLTIETSKTTPLTFTLLLKRQDYLANYNALLA
jgi:hypothetical protein